MRDAITDIVLVGGGLAAAKAAEAVRDGGYDGRLLLIGDEPHAPYERPPLSKAVLVGDAPADSTAVHPPDFYTDHDIDLVTGDGVTHVDRAAGTVTTRSGRVARFDRLLLATGATPRRLRLTDQHLDGILTLRDIDDAGRMHEALLAADHVTVVGAGWIGCEVAAAARRLGTAVTLIDPLQTPLERVLGPEVGAIFADLHRDHGVDLRTGVGVTGVRGTHRVERVVLTDDTTVDTDLVVVGVGVTPDVDLAVQAGLDVEDGITTDATLATSDPRIHAAGDVASAFHPHYQQHLRVEHWANALNQGRTAGMNLLGAGEAYDRLPYFYSDQHDLGMEYVGHAAEWDRVVFRGSTDARRFIAFWLVGGRVVAAMNVNVWDVVEQLKAFIGARVPVDPVRLADEDVPLGELV